MQMYVNPFWFGVVTGLLVEFIALMIWGSIKGGK